MLTKKAVRRPRVDVDLRGKVATHGSQTPLRGVVHDTECGDLPGTREIEGVATFWRRQKEQLGAELLIDSDGNSGLCANPDQCCWAVAGRNRGSFHVELIGRASLKRWQWLKRRRQLDKLARWMAWVNLEYGIKLQRDPDFGWSGHRDQPNADHHDPGPDFPWDVVLPLARRYRRNGWR